MKRRDFVSRTVRAGVAAFTAASTRRIHGANDRIRIALIGCGGRGRTVASALREIPGVEYVAMCDVYDLQAGQARQELAPGAKTHRDFRRALEDKGVDAVHIATPDHWHAIPAVLACQAGKHVYVEKPLAHNIREGQAMVKAAAESQTVLLTGTQHRSAPHFAEVAEIIQNGALRDVHFVRIWNYANLMPGGIGQEPDSPPPEGLDWDFYLGPAPWAPFNRKRFLRTYRAFFDYAGGWITDFGVHRFDTVHQVMGVDQPRSVCATGGRFAVGGMGDQPDLLQVTYEYPGFVLSYEASNFNGFGAIGRLTQGMTHHGARGSEDRPNGIAFYGSNGTLVADRRSYEVIPEGPRRQTAYQASGSRSAEANATPLQRMHKNAPEASAAHARHFVRCIREGEAPRCDALVGHRSTLVAHLGNISYQVGRKLRWDPAVEDFVNDPDASRLLGRQARKPWDLI